MKTIAIFGCGEAGRGAFLRLRSKCRIVAFLDNDKRKHGSRVLGVPVHDPTHYDYSRVEYVFIASMYCDEILAQLLDLRVPSSKIEYASDDALTRSSSVKGAGSYTLSNCIRAFRRLSYMPFRLLR